MEVLIGAFMAVALVGLSLIITLSGYLGSVGRFTAALGLGGLMLGEVLMLGSNYVFMPTKLVYSLIIAVAVVAALRVIVRLYPADYIKRQNWRAFSQVCLLAAAWLVAIILSKSGGFASLPLIYAIVALALSTLALIRTLNSLFSRTRYRNQHVVGYQPTITLAIPARNEGEILNETIEASLKSKYPKLEFLVLDDCSADKTPDIIKRFAHDGIRFIPGQQPAKDWLGKNYAYQELLETASGDYILFCGADIKLSPDAIDEMLTFLKRRRLRMLSVMPTYRNDSAWSLTSWQQVNRYFWQLIAANLFSRRPPVIGSCWLVERSALNELGGFKSVRQMVEPERYFARALNKRGQYAFRIARRFTSTIESRKAAREQVAHMLRVGYPLMHRDSLLTMITILAVLALGLAPICVLFYLLLQSASGLEIALLSAAGAMNILIFAALYSQVSARHSPLAIFAAPLFLAQALVIFIWSMIAYELSAVEWKGRNISLVPASFKEKTHASAQAHS